MPKSTAVSNSPSALALDGKPEDPTLLLSLQVLCVGELHSGDPVPQPSARTRALLGSPAPGDAGTPPPALPAGLSQQATFRAGLFPLMGDPLLPGVLREPAGGDRFALATGLSDRAGKLLRGGRRKLCQYWALRQGGW